ncbi:hypothetical protein BN1058_01736 [Paraliobacillus sp. PM-2]|uniref:N-acyl amino acid synthase FeeM domain-containing protein n=1 Tax=Paraliobacillus sp. PM-2 TaxID=1462524 RepID=UPI00061C2D7C|nr:hypothetical protein [Paraliobacillus sp. PM-2]CQR47424.1 hypothetical protein BN1058_01736 [Paraliobacillus sp. PM-2]
MKDYCFGSAEGVLRKDAIALHHQRYQEVGFFKRNEQDPYEGCSTYFVAQTTDLKQIVGVTRLVFLNVNELPTIKHFDIFDIEMLKLSRMDDNKYAEISAFTKMPKHDVGLGLIKTVLKYSFNKDITHWVCCIDERVYNYMHRMFKFPFEVIGEPNVYLGSKTIPCLLNLAECLAILKEKRRVLYDYFVENEDNVVGVVK